MTDDEMNEILREKLQQIADEAFKDTEFQPVVMGSDADPDDFDLPDDVKATIKDERWKRQTAKEIAQWIDAIGRLVQVTMIQWMLWNPTGCPSEDATKGWLRDFVAKAKLLECSDHFEQDKDCLEAQAILLCSKYAAAMARFIEEVGQAADEHPTIGRGGKF